MSVASDLTLDEVRAALGPHAARYTEAQLEELRVTANVFTERICETYRRLPDEERRKVRS